MIRRLRDSLRILFGRGRFEADLHAELESHLQHHVDDLVGRGIPEPEARRRARAAFGALDGAKEGARAARGIRWADELRGDLRYAFRTLFHSKGYAATAVATLALGIGANTAIFSVVDGVLLRPLPFPESHRLVQITRDYPLGALWTYRAASQSFSGVAAYLYGGELNLFAGGTAERIVGRAVSSEFFSVLKVTPLLGRTFQPGEDAPGAAPVAVISEGLWRRRFGADLALIGKSIQIDGTPRQVVGVVPRSFAFPKFGTEVWVPVQLDPKLVASVWGAGGTAFIGRLKPGASVAQADAEHRALITRVRDAYPWRMPDSFGQVPSNHARALNEVIGEGVKSRLLLLLASVGVLLLIACVNVANLNLTRLAAREREIAVRQALGGSRLRVARQLVVEQLVVALAGGAAGLALASAGIPLLLRLLPSDTPRLHEVGIDPRVLLFTALVILLAGLLASLGPIARLPGTGSAELLGAGARGS
ncbi:MAG TPA: ABC transporter permease, partial [Gemmatimonadales bacterium]